MADKEKATARTYYIPDNFIGETRVLQGAFRLRSLIEGGVIGLILGGFSLFIPIPETKVKIAVVITAIAPGLMMGIVGYNGDYISVALKYMRQWFKEKGIRLYNPDPRILEKSPAIDIIEAETGKDRAVEMWEQYQKKRMEKKEAEEYVEGETFRFKSDRYVDDYKARPMTDEEYAEYMEKMAELSDDDDIRIVARLDMSGGEDISLLDDDDDYSVDKL